MNDCNFCRYIVNDTDSSKQTCSKWVKDDEFTVPCRPEGGEPGDPPSSDNDNCMKMECPQHCQYPYTKPAYKEEGALEEHYDNVGLFPSYSFLNETPDSLDTYISNSTNEDNIKEEYRTYTSSTVPQGLNLKCGDLVVPEGENSIDFPDLPSENELRGSITHTIELQTNGINWGSLKRTDKLNQDYSDQINEAGTEVVINDYTIPISENGIELEWWTRSQLTEEELKSPLPETIRDYQTLEHIHSITGGILEYVFSDHSVENMVTEEIYDWLMKNELETGDGETTQGKFTMASFFGINVDDVTNRDFEICMNQLMMTEHDDDEYLKRINSYQYLTDLGDPNNRKDLLYVEAKITKFLIIDPSDVGDCFDIVYLTDEICETGVTSNATKIMGNFLKLNTDNVDDETYDEKMRVLTARLLKFLPKMVEKIIEIAEYYEKQKCSDEIHKSTKLLKEIYSSLFKENTMKLEMPNLGLKEFFRDFQENIFTKGILLIFIAFLVTQFIKLFNVNVNLP